MKINNINLFSNCSKVANTKAVNEVKKATNPVSNNVHFTAYTPDELSLLFPRSISQIREEVLSNSFDIAKKAKRVEKESAEILNDAKNKFFDAKDLISLGQDMYFGDIIDETGELNIKFEKYDDDSEEIDTMLEYDKYGKLRRKTIFSEELEPIVIIEYNKIRKKYNEYSFENGVSNLKYTSGIQLLGSEDYQADKCYQFDFEQISRYEEKITHIGDLDESKEIFKFVSDNEYSYTSQERRYGKGYFYKNEIYSFLDGKLKTYTKDSNIIPGTFQSNMGITIQYN